MAKPDRLSRACNGQGKIRSTHGTPPLTPRCTRSSNGAFTHKRHLWAWHHHGPVALVRRFSLLPLLLPLACPGTEAGAFRRFSKPSATVCLILSPTQIAHTRLILVKMVTGRYELHLHQVEPDRIIREGPPRSRPLSGYEQREARRTYPDRRRPFCSSSSLLYRRGTATIQTRPPQREDSLPAASQSPDYSGLCASVSLLLSARGLLDSESDSDCRYTKRIVKTVTGRYELRLYQAESDRIYGGRAIP